MLDFFEYQRHVGGKGVELAGSWSATNCSPMRPLLLVPVLAAANVELYRAFSSTNATAGALDGSIDDFVRVYTSNTWSSQRAFAFNRSADNTLAIVAESIGHHRMLAIAPNGTSLAHRRFTEATAFMHNFSFSLEFEYRTIGEYITTVVGYGARITLLGGIIEPHTNFVANGIGFFGGCNCTRVPPDSFQRPGALAYRASANATCHFWNCTGIIGCGDCQMRGASPAVAPLPLSATLETPWMYVRGDFDAAVQHYRIRARYADAPATLLVDETFALDNAYGSSPTLAGLGMMWASGEIRNLSLFVSDAIAARLSGNTTTTTTTTTTGSSSMATSPSISTKTTTMTSSSEFETSTQTEVAPKATRETAVSESEANDDHVVLIVAAVLVVAIGLAAFAHTRRVARAASQRVEMAERANMHLERQGVYSSLSALFRRSDRRRRSSVSSTHRRTTQQVYGETSLHTPEASYDYVPQTPLRYDRWVPRSDPIVTIEPLPGYESTDSALNA